MAKVYVSSTVLDLKAERQAVMDWLISAGHQPVHSYRPDGETVRESCLDDIDGCDLYVLLLGHRYGFQPEDGNPDRLSMTHLEFRRAKALPRIALLRTSVPDITLSDLLDPARSGLVKAFIAEVRTEVRAGEFADMPGLIKALSTGVIGALAKRERTPAPAEAADPGNEARVTRILSTLTDELARKTAAMDAGQAENQRLRGRVTELESQLKAAINRTLTAAQHPGAGAAGPAAVSALEAGDCALAGELLALEEEREAAHLGGGTEHDAAHRREAAALARAQGAFASTRDSGAALAAFERAAAYDPDDVWTHYLIGDLYVRLGNLAAAMRSFRRGQLLAEQHARANPGDTTLQNDLAIGYNRVGDVLLEQGDLAGALTAFRKALAMAEALTMADPSSPDWQRALAVSHNRLGDAQLACGAAADALVSYTHGARIVEALARSNPSNTLWQRDLALSHNKLSEAHFALDNKERALAAARRSLAISRGLSAGDPWNTEWRRDVSISHNNVGDVLLAQGDHESALAEFQQGLTIRTELANENPANAEWQRDLSFSLTRLADIYEREGNHAAALELAEQSLEVDERLAALDPTNVTWQKDVAYSRQQVARLTARVSAREVPATPVASEMD
jgi:tetratricopeptide (TPR) repeat protein